MLFLRYIWTILVLLRTQTNLQTLMLELLIGKQAKSHLTCLQFEMSVLVTLCLEFTLFFSYSYFIMEDSSLLVDSHRSLSLNLTFSCSGGKGYFYDPPEHLSLKWMSGMLHSLYFKPDHTEHMLHLRHWFIQLFGLKLYETKNNNFMYIVTKHSLCI